MQLLDDNGDVVRDYQYDPFGVQLQEEDGTDANPYRFCAEYFDVESGYVYLRARYYDSSTGRFISEDPAFDGYNWYAYCGNNPVMRVDPSGLFWKGFGEDWRTGFSMITGLDNWVVGVGFQGSLGLGYGIVAQTSTVFDRTGEVGQVAYIADGVLSPQASMGGHILFSWRESIYDLDSLKEVGKDWGEFKENNWGSSTSVGVSHSFMGMDFAIDEKGISGVQLNFAFSSPPATAFHYGRGTSILSPIYSVEERRWVGIFSGWNK